MKKKKKPYWERINDKFLVWTWSPKYGRYINSHMYEVQREAELTVRVL